MDPWDASHDLMLVRELLGHTSIETTQGYLLIDQTRKIEAVRVVK
jgi:site-specific recombinase XerC